jgi:hypothetical protein
MCVGEGGDRSMENILPLSNTSIPDWNELDLPTIKPQHYPAVRLRQRLLLKCRQSKAVLYFSDVIIST